MVPTKRFWLLVALGIPLAAFSAAVGQAYVILIYNVALITAAIITYKLAPSLINIRVRRKFDPVLSVRAANPIKLIIENENLESIVGEFRDEPPPQFEATQRQFKLNIRPQRTQEYDYLLTPDERGGDFFRGTYVRLQCPLGLVYKQGKLNTEQPIRVYPNVLALKEFDLLKQQGRLREMGIRRSRMRGLGTEFESLRDYAEGDDYRKVDWKASARRGKLIVRQYEQERNQAVMICIDTGRHMLSEIDGVTKLDYALDSCLMLAHAAVIAGDNVGLMVYSDNVTRYIPPKKGRNQLGIIIEALHDLVAEPVQTDSNAAYSYLATHWKRRSLIVAFTDVADKDTAEDLTTGFGPLARRHIALLANIQDPKLKECLDLEMDNPEDMFKKASARFVLEDRTQGHAVLSAAGIQYLESEPQDLASALVNAYFVIKEKSLL